MAHHAPQPLTDIDKAVLSGSAWPGIRNLLLVGVVAFIVALVATPFSSGQWARLGFAYLIGYSFALAITLGCLFFVIITTLFRAGWCTAFRRVPEVVAANMPTLAVLFLPILILTWTGSGSLYPWADPAVHDKYDDADGGHAAADAGNPLIALTVAAGGETNPDDAGGESRHPSDDDRGISEHQVAADPAGEHHYYTHTGHTWKEHDHAVPYFVHKKGEFLTPWFFTLRMVVYFGLWTLIGVFYLRHSVRQDATGDLEHTHRREWWAPLSVIAFGLTVTLASFDLLMSVDPVWYSTMFGVYFFSGSFIAALAFLIIVLMLGQRAGYFPSITTDHYHDLGKLLFAFVFFWGYVGFSQFMLIWYASLPETTYWWEIRGVTTVQGAATYGGPWTMMAWVLLFGHLLLPFAILLSKHVKRHRAALFVVACWMLVMCYMDLYWVTMPAFSSPDFVFGLPEIGCVVGCVAVMMAAALRTAARHSLMAHRDPRLHESLGLDASAWAPVHDVAVSR